MAHTQIARIGRAVGRVTTAAALSLDRHMLINERALLVGMTLDANRVAGRHGPDLPEGRCTVDVVAVAASDETFVYSMVKRLRKVCLGSGMTSVTEIRLRPHKQMFRLLGMMRRVAVQAANIIARVRRC